MGNRALITTIYVLFILFVAISVFGFIILPFFTIKEIKLDSSLTLSDDIGNIAGLNKSSSFLFLNEDQIENKILGEPLVRKVFVEKKFPDTLNITIFGRKALAISYKDTNGESTPICFDENGVIFKIGQEVDDVNLPVLSGDIDFDKITMGGQLPKILVPLLHSLKEIRGEVPDYYLGISEIVVTKRGEVTFDLIINFTFTSIKAMVKDVLTAEELKNIVVVLSLLDRESIDVEIVDFRQDEIVYREKE